MKHLAIMMLAALSVLTARAASPSAMDRGAELSDSISRAVTGARIPDRIIDVIAYGAVPDGVKDCRPAFDRAIADASESGGAVVNAPAGVYYLKGPLTLRSNVTVNVAEGATLRFSPDAADYPLVSTSWEGTFLWNHSPFIFGYNLHDVAITGKGTIDGNAGATFAKWRAEQKADQMLSRQMNHSERAVKERVFGLGHKLRPHLIQFYDCKGVTVEGVKIINSPFWCVHILMSENVVCRSVRFDAKLVNNDGIDPESSRGVIIEDVDFDNGDDNVAIKAGRDNDGWTLARPCRDILIRNCRFKGLHAVVIGSEMSAGVENVVVENCTAAGYCKRGIYVKTNADRGGYVKNVYVKNCRLGDVEDLFYVTSRYAAEGDGNDKWAAVSDIHVDGLSCRNASAAALVLQGAESSKVRRVTFDNIEVQSAPIGISFDNVEHVSMGDCHIGGHAGTPTQITPSDNIFGR